MDVTDIQFVLLVQPFSAYYNKGRSANVSPGKSSRTFVPILIFSMSQSQHTYPDECQMRKETVEEMDASDTSFMFMVLERIIIIKKQKN